MKERDNLLKTVNGPLWEATKGFSEKEVCCIPYLWPLLRLLEFRPNVETCFFLVSVLWCQVEREKELLPKEKQSSITRNEGGLVH